MCMCDAGVGRGRQMETYEGLCIPCSAAAFGFLQVTQDGPQGKVSHTNNKCLIVTALSVHYRPITSSLHQHRHYPYSRLGARTELKSGQRNDSFDPVLVLFCLVWGQYGPVRSHLDPS